MNAALAIDDLHRLTAALPQHLQAVVHALPAPQLLEVVLDVGRRPQARLVDGAVDLDEAPVTHSDLELVAARVGEFTADNRAGIEGTLHRISAIRNRRGQIVGLTLRVGRAVSGTVESIRDMVQRGRSILLLGRPGVGKTTKLREVARILADEMGKRVMVIDTSNEIAGDGDIPHPAIGSARRMQVAHPAQQHAVMIEAVENHMPQVIIIDEIGTREETVAARTIAERGVQLIGTAHGNTLANLVNNPVLSDLIGGVRTVTLGDEEARFRGTQKTINERESPPTFDVVVELVDRDTVVVHEDTAGAVDSLLRGSGAGGVQRTSGHQIPAPLAAAPAAVEPTQYKTAAWQAPGQVKIYPYCLSRDLVERVIRDLRLDARTVNRPEQADLILALRARANDNRLRHANRDGHTPVHCIKKNSTAQIRHLLRNLFNVLYGVDDSEVHEAVQEAEAAALRAIEEGVCVELAPRSAAVRKLQHRIASRHHLLAESEGSEPQRHLVIQPAKTETA